MTINLITGEYYDARKEEMWTKIAAVAPEDMPTPLWDSFLHKITDGDGALQDYLQRMAGYCMTGLTSEQVLFFFYGTGANGKGVFINTLAGIWGDYAVAAAMTTFMASPSDNHPTELAMLHGARLVAAQETESGRHWAEARIKMITGEDPITARFMRADFFTYRPQFKLVIVGNHKPSLRYVDEAIKRRIHLVPFTVTIPPEDRDKQLFEKLKPEWPGILTWAVKGCLEWNKIGLAPPAAVTGATAKYLADEDAFANWLTECCVTRKGQWGLSAMLWSSWVNWSETNREFTGSRKAFGQEIEKRGFPADKNQGMRGYGGIDLRPELKSQPPGDYD